MHSCTDGICGNVCLDDRLSTLVPVGVTARGGLALGVALLVGLKRWANGRKAGRG